MATEKTWWAVDFDDFIRPLKRPGEEPSLESAPNKSVVELLNAAFKSNVKIAIHTSRSNKDKPKIEKYLKSYGIKFNKIVTGKFSADRYFGDNYFNEVRFSNFRKSSNDSSLINLLKVVRNQKEEMYRLLEHLQENDSLAKLYKYILNVIADGKIANILLCGVGSFSSYAYQFDNEVKMFLNNRKFIITSVLGDSATYHDSICFKYGYADSYRYDFITKTKFSPKNSKNILIVFSEDIEDEPAKKVILEASLLKSCESFVFLKSPKNKDLKYPEINYIELDTDDRLLLQSVYPSIISIILNLLNKYIGVSSEV